MNDNQTTISELRRLVTEFVAQRRWEKYHDAKNLSMAVAIEAAELMEHFQWARSEELDELLADPDLRARVTDEVADIACFTLALAITLDIDLAAAIEQKMRKNALKYPAEQFQGHYYKPTDQQ